MSGRGLCPEELSLDDSHNRIHLDLDACINEQFTITSHALWTAGTGSGEWGRERPHATHTTTAAQICGFSSDSREQTQFSCRGRRSLGVSTAAPATKKPPKLVPAPPPPSRWLQMSAHANWKQKLSRSHGVMLLLMLLYVGIQKFINVLLPLSSPPSPLPPPPPPDLHTKTTKLICYHIQQCFQLQIRLMMRALWSLATPWWRHAWITCRCASGVNWMLLI